MGGLIDSDDLLGKSDKLRSASRLHQQLPELRREPMPRSPSSIMECNRWLIMQDLFRRNTGALFCRSDHRRKSDLHNVELVVAQKAFGRRRGLFYRKCLMPEDRKDRIDRGPMGPSSSAVGDQHLVDYRMSPNGLFGGFYQAHVWAGRSLAMQYALMPQCSLRQADIFVAICFPCRRHCAPAHLQGVALSYALHGHPV